MFSTEVEVDNDDGHGSGAGKKHYRSSEETTYWTEKRVISNQLRCPEQPWSGGLVMEGLVVVLEHRLSQGCPTNCRIVAPVCGRCDKTKSATSQRFQSLVNS